MTDLYRDLTDQLAEVGRAAVGRGLVVASGGNLSARCPDRDAFVVTGAGTWLDRRPPPPADRGGPRRSGLPGAGADPRPRDVPAAHRARAVLPQRVGRAR